MKNILQRLYNALVRPYLPYKISVHNGVPVRGVSRLFDRKDVFPEYEGPLIDALRHQISRGDDIVIIGGGIGVSTVVAARQAGEYGSVITYEAGETRAEIISGTIALSQFEQVCDLHHAIVGESISVVGDDSNAKVVSPNELPECNVLELDCEGAELPILRNIDIRPKDIIVETHGFLGAPESEVRTALNQLGYNIKNKEVVDDDRGIHILSAVRIGE